MEQHLYRSLNSICREETNEKGLMGKKQNNKKKRRELKQYGMSHEERGREEDAGVAIVLC